MGDLCRSQVYRELVSVSLGEETTLVFQVRIHGRGGQGVVTAAELLAQAAFDEGRHAQAFPSFGSERTGAPVVAFCRIADKEIRVREPIMAPDAVIVQDETLLRAVDVFAGLQSTGYVLINSMRTFDELGLGEYAAVGDRFITVPATQLAMQHLGRPVPNAVLLGAFAAREVSRRKLRGSNGGIRICRTTIRRVRPCLNKLRALARLPKPWLLVGQK